METQPKCWNSSLYDIYRKRYTDLSVGLEARARVSTEDVLEATRPRELRTAELLRCFEQTKLSSKANSTT